MFGHFEVGRGGCALPAKREGRGGCALPALVPSCVGQCLTTAKSCLTTVLDYILSLIFFALS